MHHKSTKQKLYIYSFQVRFCGTVHKHYFTLHQSSADVLVSEKKSVVCYFRADAVSMHVHTVSPCRCGVSGQSIARGSTITRNTYSTVFVVNVYSCFHREVFPPCGKEKKNYVCLHCLYWKFQGMMSVHPL